MITDQQRAELLEVAPFLSNDELDVQNKISCLMGIILRLLSAMEESLAMAAIMKAFSPKRIEELRKNPKQFEREVHEKSLSLSSRGLDKLKGIVSSIPEFQHLKEELELANEKRNFFVHHFSEVLSPLFNDEEGQWHIMWELMLLARSFSQTSHKIMSAVDSQQARLGIPSTPDKPERVRQGRRDEAMAMVATGDLCGEWKRRYKR